jgi:hypothetical protein
MDDTSEQQIRELSGSVAFYQDALAAITREEDAKAMKKIAEAALVGISAPKPAKSK